MRSVVSLRGFDRQQASARHVDLHRMNNPGTSFLKKKKNSIRAEGCGGIKINEYMPAETY
jgi:hypothetical protein